MYIQNNKYKTHVESYENNRHVNVILGALLIILLSIYSDSIRSLIPKKTISFFFTENIYTKYFVLLSVIYFLIDFSYKNKHSPLFELGMSVIIMILFIMYTKIHFILCIVIFILLGIIYFIQDIIAYNKQNIFDSNNKLYSKYKSLYNIKDSLVIISFLLLVIGFIIYFFS